MYTVSIQDSKGGYLEFEHIIKITYSNSLGNTTLEGEDIFTHMYPTHYDLHLFSETDAYTVSKDAIKFIQVSKEN